MKKRTWIIFLGFILLIIIVTLILWERSFLQEKDSEIKKKYAQTVKTENITYAQRKDLTYASKTLIEMFEKEHPNIKVNFEELPTSSDDQHNIYATKFSAEVTSYDVIAMDTVWTSEFIESGWLEPLNEHFRGAERERFFERMLKPLFYKGYIYGVPRMTDMGVLFYRKDIIQKPPETWDELINMCNEYIGAGRIKWGVVFQGKQYEGLVCNAVEFIGGYGGTIMENGRVTINSPQTINGLRMMRKLIEEKYAPPETTIFQEDDTLNIFKQGDALFMRNWPGAWVLLDTDENSKIKEKVGISRIPKGKIDSESTSCLGGWNLGINKNSSHKEAAWEFIEFLTSNEGQKISALSAGLLPTRKDLYKDQDILRSNPYYGTIYDILNTTVSRPESPSYSVISDQLQINIHKVITGEVSSETAVDNLNQSLSRVVAEK